MKLRRYLAIALLAPILTKFNNITTEGIFTQKGPYTKRDSTNFTSPDLDNKDPYASCDSVNLATLDLDSKDFYASCDSINSTIMEPDSSEEPANENLSNLGEWIDYADSNFFNGDGLTEETAFEIASANQLALLSKRANFADSKKYYYYKIVADIDLNDHFWNAIGSEDNPFYGSIDGNGFKISNLKINSPSNSCQGLFGRAKEGSCFKNLTVDNCLIAGDFFVGSIIGLADGVKIESCNVGCSIIQADFNLAGGIIGLARENCIVSNCKVENTLIKGDSLIGCFCGDPRGISMSGCTDTGTSVVFSSVKSSAKCVKL